MFSRILVAMAMFTAVSALAAEKDSALTVYAGFRDGGSFTDVDTDEKLSLDSSAAGSLALDFGLDTSRQWQIFLSHQRTDLSLKGTSSASGDALGMSVTYLHFGGTSFFTGTVGKGPYVVGGIGATVFDPDSGFDTELRASLNLGLGYQLPLSETFALRFEARGYATLVNSSGGLFCSGGCVVSIEGDVITQGELMLGLSTRF
ncbi:MAG TPA: outer membrane beta-barrel protein [Burkholderiales bacterium]|nr:outer membrane beta-barrel protein [Burkholderiales bacterium]